MNTRLDKLIKVRRVAARLASGAYAESAGRALQQISLLDRLTAASDSLSVVPGAAMGQAVASQLELAGRMRAAKQVARDRADAARAQRSEAANERKASIRALDAAIDIHRAADRKKASKMEGRATPPKGQMPS